MQIDVSKKIAATVRSLAFSGSTPWPLKQFGKEMDVGFFLNFSSNLIEYQGYL